MQIRGRLKTDDIFSDGLFIFTKCRRIKLDLFFCTADKHRSASGKNLPVLYGVTTFADFLCLIH